MGKYIRESHLWISTSVGFVTTHSSQSRTFFVAQAMPVPKEQCCNLLSLYKNFWGETYVLGCKCPDIYINKYSYFQIFLSFLLLLCRISSKLPWSWLTEKLCTRIPAVSARSILLSCCSSMVECILCMQKVSGVIFSISRQDWEISLFEAFESVQVSADDTRWIDQCTPTTIRHLAMFLLCLAVSTSLTSTLCT